MDLLKLIKEKADYFSTSIEDIGISNVVTHIEIAEKHFEGGKAGEDYLFNDVIYRSNQAFEGALKEAYRIIEGKDPNNLTPHKIEKYFEENKILKERVLQLFTNYRTEWRNKSTHDYKLYFSEQEALLAVMSISAFVNILIDQMIEKKSFDKESINIRCGVATSVQVHNTESLVERIIELLVSFSTEVPKIIGGSVLPRIKEVELLGTLTAFLNSYASNVKVYPEYLITHGSNLSRYYADMLLKTEEEEILIELKSGYRRSSDLIARGTEQLFNYLLASGISNGILYIPPRNDSEEMSVSRIERTYDDKIHIVFQVCPSSIVG